MLSLSINTPPQAQLEALRDLPDRRSGSSSLHASLELLNLFDSARLDLSGRFDCSYDPSQLPCYRGVGASSAWPLVDLASPNRTFEPTRLSLIRFHFCLSWLSPTRPQSSGGYWPSWHCLPLVRLAPTLPFSCSSCIRLRLLQPFEVEFFIRLGFTVTFSPSLSPPQVRHVEMLQPKRTWELSQLV